MNQKTKEVRYIDVFKIDISGINYRKTIDEKEVKELAENIKNFGLINPITVRVSGREDSVDENTGEVISIPAKWQVVCGERRLRAYKYLGEEDVKNKNWQKIACIVYDKLSDGEMAEMMMTENLQRKDVEPFEEAFGFSVMLNTRGEKRSVEDVARLFGKTVEFVRNRIQLNNAIDEVREMVKNGHIGLSIAMYIARFEQKEQRAFIKENIFNEGCTLSSVKSRVENYYHSSLSKVLFSESERVGDFRACELCPMNSACQGKLFGDIGADEEDHYCRDRECYDNKNFAKLLEKIAAEPEGTRYSVWDEETDIIERLKAVGVIVHEWWKAYKYADGFERPDKSDYDDEENGFDEERYDKDVDEWKEKVRKAIANKEVFRVINIKGYSSLEWDERIAELREEAVNIECEDVENKSRREVLEAKDRDNLEKINENKNKKFREVAKENDEYLNDGNPLSAEEIQLLHALVMYQAGYEAHNIFKKDEKQKEWKSIDDIRFSKEEYNKLVRGFIRESVTVPEVQWNEILKMCLGKYMEIANKKKFEELTEKYRKSYENKKKKIDLKIKELEG